MRPLAIVLAALALSACGSLQSARIETGRYRLDGSGHERERASVTMGRDDARSRITLGVESMILEDGSRVPGARAGVESTIVERSTVRAFALGSVGITEFGGKILEPDFALGIGAELSIAPRCALRASAEHHFSDYGDEPAFFLGIVIRF